MTKKITITGPAGQEIAASMIRRNDPEAPDTRRTLVLMSHGFPGHKSAAGDIFGDLEEMLSSKGHDTLRFDYRGCGESDGREENFTVQTACADYEAVQDWARREGYSQFIVIGEGLGATIAALNIGLDVRAFAMLWPVLEPKMYFKNHIAQAVPDPEGRPFSMLDSHRIGKDFAGQIQKLDIVHALKEVYCPALIMHGAEDDVVPTSQLELARGFIPARRIEITVFHDGTHGLPLPAHRKAMMYHIQQFVQKYA
ncbi:MAG TPA: alpha/beta fold hydrolase [Alphaproteobacteria bacterium]|nr:alpha/beta fold hydrolase [Alphaproteobacteria bacterium]